MLSLDDFRRFHDDILWKRSILTKHRLLRSIESPPMVQRAAERAATSRKNGARSKGPTSDAGKLIASRNSTTHALTAKKVVLPNECPLAVAARTEEWVDCFRPATPDARFLLG